MNRFGMAEQAINTIYLLGEQPDLLCGQIIKNLTSKVFTPSSGSKPADETAGEDGNEGLGSPVEQSLPVPPTPAKTIDMSAPTPFKMRRSESQDSVRDDHAGSFPLAQLVFVVGHVAIKHIVYLELVEREFKRRKDENAKRGWPIHDQRSLQLTIQRKPPPRPWRRIRMTSMPLPETLKTTLETSSPRSGRRSCYTVTRACSQCMGP